MEVSSVNVVQGGQDYKLHDAVEAVAPLQYAVGQAISLQARVNDPRGDLNRTAFYVNGVELPRGQVQSLGNNIYTVNYTPTDVGSLNFSVRALYGDDRDLPPPNYSSCGCHKRNESCVLMGRALGMVLALVTTILLTH